jgi:hypothetical protein
MRHPVRAIQSLHYDTEGQNVLSTCNACRVPPPRVFKPESGLCWEPTYVRPLVVTSNSLYITQKTWR